MAQAPRIDQNEDSSTQNERRWLTIGGPILFLLLWSAGFPIAKTGLHYASPLTFLSIRFALSVGVLLAVCAIRRPQWPRNARAWLHLGVVGFLVQVMYFGLSYLSMTAGIATSVLALIVSLQPILVGVLAPKFVGERIGVRRWIGLLLGLAGAAGVIAARGPLHAAFARTGVARDRRAHRHHGRDAVREAARHGAGSADVEPRAIQRRLCVLRADGAAFEHTQVQWTPTFIATLAYLVIGNSLIAITLLLAMTRAGKVSQVASLFFFIPPAAAVMSYFFLGEVLPAAAWWAMGVAVLGVAIATWTPRK